MSIAPPKQPAILLFDIDGTLMTAGGAGKRAFELGLETVCGLEDGLRGIRLAGCTDRGIARTALENAGIEPKTETLDAVLASYLDQLPAVMADSPKGYWRLNEITGNNIAVDSSGNGNDFPYETVRISRTGTGSDVGPSPLSLEVLELATTRQRSTTRAPHRMRGWER